VMIAEGSKAHKSKNPWKNPGINPEELLSMKADKKHSFRNMNRTIHGIASFWTHYIDCRGSGSNLDQIQSVTV
jgi:hypothetical protein